MSIKVENKTIETDEEGYLLDPNQWDECVAEAIAAQEGIELTAMHWAMINYFRTFYEDHMRHPSMHEQASLRSRERFWDIRVPKIDSIFDNSLVPRPSWSPGVPPQHRKLVAATHRSPI